MPNHNHAAPSDLVQVPIVWRYELLRYLRSWRLAASIAVAIIVLMLFFLLPPAFGHPYSGIATQDKLDVKALVPFPLPPIPGVPQSVALIQGGDFNVTNVIIYVNGTEYPHSDYQIASGSSLNLSGLGIPASGTLALFYQDLSKENVTATYNFRITAQSFDSINLQFASFLIIICATFFGADSIVGEFWNRTGYLVFPNPVKRSVMFFGKYAASMTAGGIVISVLYIGVIGLSFVTAHGVDGMMWLSFLFAIEYLGAAIAIGYLVSSILRGTTGSIILTFFLLLLILPIIDQVSTITGTYIPESVTFSSRVITYILVTPYPTTTSQDVGPFSLTNFIPDPATSAVVMFLWAAIALAISLILFKRKQMLG